MVNAGLVAQLQSLSQRLQSLESSSDASSTHSSKSSGRLCADDLREGTTNISIATSPHPLRARALSDVHLHDQPHPMRNAMPDVFELSPQPRRDLVPHTTRTSDASAEPLASITDNASLSTPKQVATTSTHTITTSADQKHGSLYVYRHATTDSEWGAGSASASNRS